MPALLGPTSETSAQQQFTPGEVPTPSGRFAVGTRVVYLTDSSRKTSRRIQMRPLSVQLWYPAQRGTGGTAPYVVEPGLIDSMKAGKYLDLTSAEMDRWTTVTLSARLNAVPARAARASGWPIVLLSHGMGIARAHYAALSQELASHGFVVLAIDHPIGGFTLDPKGAVLTPGVDTLAYPGPPFPFVVRDWALDGQFAIRWLAAAATNTQRSDKLRLPGVDTGTVAALGHSLGGAAALDACRSVQLVRVCIDLDGDPYGDVETKGVGKPFLTLLSQPDHANRPAAINEAESLRRREFAQMEAQRDSMWLAIAALNAPNSAFIVKLVGTGHMSFSDAPFQMPSLLRGVGASLDANRAQNRIESFVLEFLNHFLLGAPRRLLSPGLSTRP